MAARRNLPRANTALLTKQVKPIVSLRSLVSSLCHMTLILNPAFKSILLHGAWF